MHNFTSGVVRLSLISILIGIGILVTLPNISAQEIPSEEGVQSISAENPVQEENPLRAREREFTIGGDAQADAAATGSSAWAIVRMLLVLALAAAAVYGIVFFLKKKTKGQLQESDPFLKVLANAHLGNNRYAHIVSVGSKAWLLGSSDGGVNLIGEIDDKDVLNAMLLEDSKRNTEAASSRNIDFMSILRKLGTPVDKKFNDSDEIRRRRERLKQM